VGASNSLILGGTGASAVNVGIGTSTPWAKLSIQHTNGSFIPLLDIASSTNSGGSATSSLFRVNYDGNVGIGTTNPYNLLTISKNVTGQSSLLTLQNIHGAANDTADIDFVITSVNNPLARIGATRTNRGGSGDTDLVFSTYTNSLLGERMRLMDNGNLGIATTSPWAKLSVSGGGSDLGHFGYAGYFTATNTSATSTFSGGLSAGSSNALIVTNGKVGIGTVSPMQKLSVNGNIWIPNSSQYQSRSAADTFNYNLISNDTSDRIIIGDNSQSVANEMQFFTTADHSRKSFIH